MPIALTPQSEYEYQLECDRLPDGGTDPSKTVFVFQPLTVQAEAEIQNQSFVITPGGVIDRFNVGSNILARLKYGLKGWRNFQDASGAPVEFSISNLSRLSPANRRELSDAHAEHYSLTTAEGN